MIKIFFIIAGVFFTCMLVTNYAPTWWVEGFNLPRTFPAVLANMHIAYAWVAISFAGFVGFRYLHAK